MILHKHHIIPRHAGGTDDPENLVELSIEEHADAHRVLFEKHGRWQDYLAWKGLTGAIGKDEIREEFYKHYRGENHHMFGVKRPEHAEQMRERMLGENNPMFGKATWNKGLTYKTGPNPLKGHPKNDFAKNNKGKIQSYEWKEKRASKLRGKTYELTCPHCDKTGGRMMLRWHFDNCRTLNNT